jgi:hypothetical protein
MKVMFSGSVAVVMMFGMAVFAQTPSQPRSETPQAQQRAAAGERVTVVGCVQHEADYRRAHEAGRGGVAGTGVGTGNEFVLANASMSSGRPTGTAGSAAGETAYELTGPNEGLVAQHVGKRVEITGTLKPAEVTASGRPTGGATAGAPPEGVDVTSKDLRLRELEITTVRAATGTCPANR